MLDPRKTVIFAALSLVAPAGLTAGQSLDLYYLGPSDRIEVSVWQEPTLSTTVTVRPDGKISLPLIGSVDVSGRTPEEVEADLRERFRTYLGDPIVVVIVSGFSSAQVSVLGEVQRPGRFALEQRLSVLDIIAAAGGFTDFADIDNVLVLRPDESGIQRVRVNVKDLLDDESEDLLILRPGDIVYVK